MTSTLLRHVKMALTILAISCKKNINIPLFHNIFALFFGLFDKPFSTQKSSNRSVFLFSTGRFIKVNKSTKKFLTKIYTTIHNYTYHN